jgi:Fe-S-cluster containining protein
MTEETVDAGPFSAWLAATRTALRGSGGTDVPCGDCTGCCTSGYSLQIRPSDARALAAIPVQMLVDSDFAPGQKTLLPQSDGRCMMLREGRCSIYAHRPQTCLDYDCRVFAAAGVLAGGADKSAINRRVRAWRFSYPAEIDRREQVAVRAAAAFIRGPESQRRGSRLPLSPMGIAVLAIKAYPLFLPGEPTVGDEAVLTAAVLAAASEFDSATT